MVHFRLLVLSDFAVDPFPVVDQDVSDVVEAQEFQSFGGMLAVHNSSNTMELFQILESWLHLIELVLGRSGWRRAALNETLSDADKV